MLIFRRPVTSGEAIDAAVGAKKPLKGGYREPDTSSSYRIILESHDINYLMNSCSVARLVDKHVIGV